MEIAREFSNLGKENVAIAGGKGASLGEMTQAGIPIPEGFVVLSEAFESFIKETDLNVEIDAILDSVNTDEVHTVEEASEKIQALILNKEIPEDISQTITKSFDKLGAEYVAVRSSATSEDSAAAAWAGQLDTFLNTTKNTLLENVRRCWASLFTPRAIFYRFEKNLHRTDISVAVVVQKMINSEESGIAFSVHPVTQDYNQLIIEAGFGLGEAIVSGQITPDSYVVDKQDWHIIDININEQVKGLFRKEGGGNEWEELADKGKEQVLNEKEILELSKLIVKIEKHYSFPCDIEWAKEKGKFYITQSRPITTLTEKGTQEETLVKQFKREIGNDELLVVRGKFIPLFLLTDWLKFYDEKFKDKEGIYPVLSIKKNDIFTHYISLDKYLGISQKAIERYINDLKYKEKINDRYNKIKDKINSFYRNYFESKTTTEKDFLETLRKSEEYLHELVAITLFIDFLDENIVKKTYTDKGIKLDFKKIFKVSEIYDFPSFDLKNNIEIVKEAKDNVEYLKHVYTGYSAAPTKEEVKEKISKLDIEGIKKDIELSEKEIKKKAEEKKKLISDLNSDEKFVADFLSWVIELRDDRKPLMNKLDVIMNESVRALYEKWGMKKELSFVSYAFEVLRGKKFCLDNIENVEKREGDFVNLYYGNNEYSEKYENLEDELKDSETLEKPKGDVEEIKGQIANKGNVKGLARIIYDPKKFHSFTEGDILVTSMTRPEFVPIMKKASAIVTNEGGIACHAAIVSRELNKPCIIGTKNATEIIRDGDEIEVDADNGIVRVLNGETTKSNILDKFMKGFERDVFYPLVPVSILAAGAGGFTPNFGGKVKDLNIKFLIAMKEGKAFVLMSETRYNIISENFFVKYIKNNEILPKTLSYLYGLEKEINEIYADLSYEEVKNRYEKDIIKKLERIINLVREYNCTAWFSTQFDKELVSGFIKKHNLKLKLETVEKIWDKAIIPTEDSFDKRRHKKILKLISESSGVEDIAKEMQYSYSGYTEIKSVKDVEKDIKKEYQKYIKDNDEASKELERDALEYKKTKKSFNKWRSSLSKEEKGLVDYIQAILVLRDKRKDVMGKGIVINFRVGERFFEEVGLDKELIYYCAYEEFLNGKNYFDIKKAEILSREKGVLFLHNYNGSTEFQYGNFEEIKKKMEETYIKSQKKEGETIEGQVAYKGDIRGIVKVVLRPSEFSKFNKGDILVTSMTRPEFVPLMKKAKAIITDEGGITSHAAIISRELRIPCIIGTKVATKMLNDGDEVELGSENGSVRVLKKIKG